jgi:hypothetical protein
MGLMIVSSVSLLGWVGKRHLDRKAEVRAFEAATNQLRDAKARADSCAIELGWEQEQFLDFDRRVDSLRSVLQGYEIPDRGGVPEKDYPEYMQVFEAYNDSVSVWQSRADAVKATEGACRSFTQVHNTLRDSILARFGTTRRRAP